MKLDSDLEKYWVETELLTNSRLVRFFKVWQKEADVTHQVIADLVRRLITANYGGKRVRAVLVRLGFEMAGGKNLGAIITVAASYEILHSFLLIHDDIMDNASLRRGIPTLHLQFQKLHQEKRLAKITANYGTAMAMTAGDIANFLFLKLFLESDFDDLPKLTALDYLTQVLVKTGFGQALDVDLGLRLEKAEKDVFTIHTLKTAQYSLAGPLVVGAILAGASKKLQRQLEELAIPLGLAFQIKDDILGIFGEEEITGKSPKSDIAEGKNTLLITYALKNANRKQLASLKRIYGRQPVKDDDLTQIREIFENSGALAYSETQAKKLLAKSLVIISKLPCRQESRDLMSQLAHFLVLREK